MCLLITGLLAGLLLLYSDSLLDQYALVIPAGEGEWTVVALGWEILPWLWPLLLVVALLTFGITLFIARRFTRNKT